MLARKSTFPPGLSGTDDAAPTTSLAPVHQSLTCRQSCDVSRLPLSLHSLNLRCDHISSVLQTIRSFTVSKRSATELVLAHNQIHSHRYHHACSAYACVHPLALHAANYCSHASSPHGLDGAAERRTIPGFDFQAVQIASAIRLECC